ncbi:aldehyde dehydrogenase family protein [Streptosporangium roseum]|uniref:Betaine-aldehyde dehydrogenase n=1 Tax=Streptosporangium roseum (strain ATCC 12428 / DSM 43021 / JCM 3005 / KCTC 9067 / NCIMB 10171 / NRRL 2505 / NI 9100) TaxID=479432 RepID=D2BBX0_STRRD|nr:aldehyde dehydrogenase family protein [Streptosporangium roseum]ACZ87993.1 Betaine-aldehyde dehydrogenase [Streptosporangium roseum DSM 43021]
MTYSIDTLLIDGRRVPAESGEVLTVVNPATGEVFATAPSASRRDAVAAITAARRAFEEGRWPRLSSAERGRLLKRLALAMDRRREELIDLVIKESGFPRAVADRVHLQSSIDFLCDLSDRLLPGLAFTTPLNPHTGISMTGRPQTTQGMVVKEPIGVAALITPFNAAVPLTVHKLGWALAAGCTTVVRPSPYTPLQVLFLADLIEEAGFPPGVVNIITGDLDAGLEMTTHPDVDIISFTGSDAVGRRIMAQAAPTLKKVVLELGGKSANIVFADADLDRAALEVMGNIVSNAGQGCLLLTRTLVEEPVHDELLSKVVALLSTVTVGDPADPATVMGPLISARERDRVEAMIHRGVAEGATLAYGGGRPAGLGRGFFLEPTLFTDVDNSMSIAQQEFFGPVNTVIGFKDDAEAVRIANDSDFGLNAGIFTQDFERAYATAARIRSGTVNINASWGTNPDAPFGGYKQSGLGREGGAYGIAEFLEEKFVSWPVGRL